MSKKPDFMNFAVDHMTLLLHPKLYNVAYCIFRIIFGTTPDDLLYEKRRPSGGKEVSMTFANRIGEWQSKDKDALSTIIAVVQPSEPANESSHVRTMLDGHQQVAHWQHIALRTPDLIAFHKHALERGVQFVTPILKDEHENLIQVFSGEWYFPGSKASAVFFEFLQRDPSDDAVAEIQKANKQTWFRDETFMGLYGEKEREYQSGNVRPFLPEALFNKIYERVGQKQVWEISDKDIGEIEQMMIEFTAQQNKK
ncbi:MAG: hypothetical protein K2Q26_09820 [Bdellovibrionales bacterium]|nr:hypothetical protein [Bdellovibrionales bacterium]